MQLKKLNLTSRIEKKKFKQFIIFITVIHFIFRQVYCLKFERVTEEKNCLNEDYEDCLTRRESTISLYENKNGSAKQIAKEYATKKKSKKI